MKSEFVLVVLKQPSNAFCCLSINVWTFSVQQGRKILLQNLLLFVDSNTVYKEVNELHVGNSCLFRIYTWKS